MAMVLDFRIFPILRNTTINQSSPTVVRFAVMILNGQEWMIIIDNKAEVRYHSFWIASEFCGVEHAVVVEIVFPRRHSTLRFCKTYRSTMGENSLTIFWFCIYCSYLATFSRIQCKRGKEKIRISKIIWFDDRSIVFISWQRQVIYTPYKWRSNFQILENNAWYGAD